MTRLIGRLLAKAVDDPEAPDTGCSLLDHSLATLAAADVILGAVGADALAAIGLPGDPWSARLRTAVRAASFAHDLGKANDHFQAMVRAPGRGLAQAYRHEQVSLWLVGPDGPLADWLLGDADAAVRLAVRCAVVGHHLKFDPKGLEYGPSPAPATIVILAGHPDLAATLAAGAPALGRPCPPTLCDVTFNPYDDPLCDGIARSITRQVTGDQCRRFVAIVKSLVLVADVVASATVGEGDTTTPVADWLRASLDNTCTSDLLHEVAVRRLGGRPPRAFQDEVAASASPVTLVRAGCGSGKTVGAYLWGAHHAAGRKFFVCYPTTGTATEGFVDHLHELGIGRLVHGRADIDLERLHQRTPRDATVATRITAGDELAPEAADDWATLDRSLRVWSEPTIVCTVDAVLGVLQNYRSGHFALPALLRSAVVFDEIHQYDDRLFSALVRFLDTFPGIPVLLMTASLQPGRRALLDDACARRGIAMPVIDGPHDLQAGDRYAISRGDPDGALDAAGATVRAGSKVLWVANTVDAAMVATRRLVEAGLAPLTYHSRFRYCDRIDRHEEVIEAFRAPGGAVAVTTQVCEVSLDLSADLLVTEIAPAPSLVQRLGRLNRRFDPAKPETRRAMVIEPGTHRPYTQPELATARAWLDTLADRPVSQADLATAYEAIATPDDSVAQATHVWLDAQPFASPSPLRDADTTVQVLLHDDTHHCVRPGGRIDAAKVTLYAIPMPLGAVVRALGAWRRLGMAFVAPPGSIEYAPRLGGRWAS